MPVYFGEPSDSQHIKKAAAMRIAAGILQPSPLVKGPLPDANEEKSIRDWMSRVRHVACLIMEEYGEPKSG